jgi:hypothetical protein
MPLRYELVTALVADEGPFTRVRAQVSLEVACLDELLEAFLKGADEYLRFFLGSGRFKHR